MHWLVLLALSLIGRVQVCTAASMALLYDTLDCDIKQLRGLCTRLVELKCCSIYDLEERRPMIPAGSAQVVGPPDAYSVIGVVTARTLCEGVMFAAASNCLQTGDINVEGIWWFRFSSAAGASTINSTQYADIHILARPGEQRKPYSVTVVDRLHHADAIDWSTQTFKFDKLSVVEEITAQHGNGLNEDQLAALIELKESYGIDLMT